MEKKAAAKPAKKKTTKKPAAKKPLVIENFFEVDGEQVRVDVEEVKGKIYEAYKNDGHRTSNIRSLKVYYNLPERKAYYVINGKEEGKSVDL